VKARTSPWRAGAPLVPGTSEPVRAPTKIITFAKEFGLPVAIKAAYGGGGRGLKVARTIEEIPSCSNRLPARRSLLRARRVLRGALPRPPRHVETQCLADEYGAVVVVSTRDCSLQRRNQKLGRGGARAVPQRGANHRSCTAPPKAILAEAGYVGAGTCEFLVGPDGTISFLEVNTRLQVEHPVTEEVTGIDLVREQLRNRRR